MGDTDPVSAVISSITKEAFQPWYRGSLSSLSNQVADGISGDVMDFMFEILHGEQDDSTRKLEAKAVECASTTGKEPPRIRLSADAIQVLPWEKQ